MKVRALTIGDFGRRCGLSVKALRLYDLSGLLPPAQVDPVSGYRWYTEAQLDRARRISELRRLDMPLAVVADVLAGSDEEAVLRLDSWWAAQEASMQERRGTLDWLRNRLLRRETAPPAYKVRTRDVPAGKVAAIRRDTDQQGLIDAIRESEQSIRTHLGAAADGTGSFVIYHGVVSPDSEAPIEVCVPAAGAVEPAGEIVIRIEPAHTEAYAVVTRDDCYFPRIMHAYDAVETAFPTGAGPWREVYLAAWCETAGTDPFVYVARPV
jgi:DNA-binding transcriptional MerR regulator